MSSACLCVCTIVLYVFLVNHMYNIYSISQVSVGKIKVTQSEGRWCHDDRKKVPRHICCVSGYFGKVTSRLWCRESEPWCTLSAQRGAWTHLDVKTKQHSNWATLLTGMLLLVWRNPHLLVYFCMFDGQRNWAHTANMWSYCICETKHSLHKE